ncbi:hypothetical protein AB3X94_08015 [Paraburkholderia sp. BR10923]|uniref:hypothetical protein n=1 Tax=Paraburkholderia sp. BR10923 TaxID=3236992 RepID=UPI0034CDF546
MYTSRELIALLNRWNIDGIAPAALNALSVRRFADHVEHDLDERDRLLDDENNRDVPGAT